MQHSEATNRALNSRTGALLVIASALTFSLSGVLTKTIEADVWTILCWRGLIGGLMIAIYVVVRRRHRSIGMAFRLGRQGWILASIGSLASITFIYAFRLTYVANVTLIYSTVPFMTAALGWWLLREHVPTRTVVAGVVSFAGVICISVSAGSAFNLSGDFLAVIMTFGNALYIVLVRRFQVTSTVWAGGASALQLFFVGCLMTDPLAVSRQDSLLLILFGLTFAAAIVLWTEGTRLIAAAQSGLLGTIDTPIAILLAWLVLAELPSAGALLGGAIVLTAVLGHAAIDALQTRESTKHTKPM